MLSKSCVVNHVWFLGDLIFGHTTAFLDTSENTVSHTVSQSVVFEIASSFQMLWKATRENSTKVWILCEAAEHGPCRGSAKQMPPRKAEESLDNKDVTTNLSDGV